MVRFLFLRREDSLTATEGTDPFSVYIFTFFVFFLLAAPLIEAQGLLAVINGLFTSVCLTENVYF